MKKSVSSLFLASFFTITASVSNAAVIEYSLEAFSSFDDDDITNTYTGNGYVGMFDDAFGGLFGIEDDSRTALQVNVSTLQGATINSATLSFDLLDGFGVSQTVTATGFSANGTLGHFWNAPDNLYQDDFTVAGRASNALDITQFLIASLGANLDWFGLHLTGSSFGFWTYVNGDYSADRATVRLVVDYDPDSVSVPEPATLALFGLGLAGLAFRRRNTV